MSNGFVPPEGMMIRHEDILAMAGPIIGTAMHGATSMRVNSAGYAAFTPAGRPAPCTVCKDPLCTALLTDPPHTTNRDAARWRHRAEVAEARLAQLRASIGQALPSNHATANPGDW